MHFVRVIVLLLLMPLFKSYTYEEGKVSHTPFVIALNRYFLNAGDSFGQLI